MIRKRRCESTDNSFEKDGRERDLGGSEDIISDKKTPVC